MTSPKDYYKAKELEGYPRHFKDLKSAILCSIEEHSAFYVDENKQIHTFFEGRQLIIKILSNEEPTYKLKEYL
jgi:hypothetical protein